MQLDLVYVLEEGQTLAAALGTLQQRQLRLVGARVRAEIETLFAELGLLVGRDAELAALGAEDFSSNSAVASAGQQA